MKNEKLKSQSLEEVAKSWGIDYQVGHMTIDKLVEILTVLKFKVAVKAKAA